MNASRCPRLPAGLLASLLVATLPGSVAAQDYYTDVRPLLVRECAGCHSESGVAWSMEDPEATYGRASRIARAITERRMPPWLAEAGHQEYRGDRSLDAEAVEMVRRWADAGYPMGESRPDPARPHPAVAGGMAHVFEPATSLDVLPDGPYLPRQDRPDDYRCFLVEWTGSDVSYMTGFRASPGNRNVAHHVVVHAVVPELADRFRELEAEEEGPGYQCFGGALPDRLGSREARRAYEARYPDGVRELSRGNFWLAHWAPGMDGHVFPEGTGVRLDPGTLLVVQMHYYSSDAPGESDADTHVDFMVEPRVERPAFHLSQTRGDWLGASRNETMVVPPGTQRSFEVVDNLGSLLGYISRITQVDQSRISGLELHSANLHMHSFGHSGRVSLRHATGRKETLLAIPRWDLAWQRDFTFTQPKVLGLEELEDTYLMVECTFENPTGEAVYGGYGSMEEMCFNFSYIAVRTGGS